MFVRGEPKLDRTRQPLVGCNALLCSHLTPMSGNSGCIGRRSGTGCAFRMDRPGMAGRDA